MAQVSTEGIKETTGEIRSAVHILRSVARETSSKCAAIKGYASELNSYNGARVKESIHTIGLTEPIIPTTKSTITTYKCYNTFDINTGNIVDVANSLAQRADEVYETVANILAKLSNINEIAEAIEGYIEKVQSVLGDNISAKALGAASLAIGQDGIAKANLAKSSEDLKNRNFIDYDTFKNDANFSSGKLSFELQEDGSYLVKSNGESTGYYTSGLTAALYLDTVRTVMKDNGEEVADLPYNKSNTMNENIKNVAKDVIDGVKNIKDKAETAATIVNEKLAETGINSQTSDDSENIQVVFSNFDESSEPYVQEKFTSENINDQKFIANISNHDNYSIPEGKNLCDESGSIIAISGDTLSYDGTGYTVKSSSSDLDSTQYSLDELAKSNFADN